MKIIIERSALLKSLAHVQSVVERRNTIPILGTVKITAAEGTMTLYATDLDIGISEAVTTEIPQSGETTVPVHTFYEIVRKLPDGAQVSLETNDAGKLTLKSGRSVFTLGCLPVEDFPTLEGGAQPQSFVLAAAEIRTLIDRTQFAISTEETRYYLNGIYLHAAETTDGPAVLRAVSTDGHRLASVQAPLPEGAATMPGVIVPRKTVAELRKVIDEYTGDVDVSLSETKIRFAFAETVLVSKLIDGTFPDYQRVIPEGNDKVLDVDASILKQAVDRVSAISSEKSRAIKLSLSSGLLVLSASSPESGTATEELEVDYGGGAIEIGFNSRYLLDIVQQMEGDTARLLMADDASPTVLSDTDDPNALYVLMPMRV